MTVTPPPPRVAAQLSGNPPTRGVEYVKTHLPPRAHWRYGSGSVTNCLGSRNQMK